MQHWTRVHVPRHGMRMLQVAHALHGHLLAHTRGQFVVVCLAATVLLNEQPCALIASAYVIPESC